jgi:hypothetical protein
MYPSRDNILSRMGLYSHLDSIRWRTLPIPMATTKPTTHNITVISKIIASIHMLTTMRRIIITNTPRLTRGNIGKMRATRGQYFKAAHRTDQIPLKAYPTTQTLHDHRLPLPQYDDGRLSRRFNFSTATLCSIVRSRRDCSIRFRTRNRRSATSLPTCDTLLPPATRPNFTKSDSP